jgi:ribosomal protein L2
LSIGKLSFAGRNVSGNIVVRHKGSGSFKNLTMVDFKRK